MVLCCSLNKVVFTGGLEKNFVFFTVRRHILQEALYAAPRTLRNFVSAKTFMDLLHINDARTNELVPVDSIIDFLVVKKEKLKKMISLHYYDSAGKGYLSVEVGFFLLIRVKFLK